MKKTIKKFLGRTKHDDKFFQDLDHQFLFKSLIKNSPTLIFVIDKQGLIKVAEGKALKSIKCFQSKGSCGVSIFTTYKDFPEIINGFKKALKGVSNTYVFTVEGVSFLSSISPLKNSKGKIVGAQSISVEVTKQVMLEEKLKQSEESYRTIFNSSSDAIFIHDIKTGQILDVNKKMIEMFGFAKKEALAGNVGMISSGVFPYDQAEAKKKVLLAASGSPQVFEWHSKTKKGELFWTEVSLGRVVLDGQERIVATVRDITERKIVEEQLIHISKMKNEFLSIAAHQLRTPLGAMRWNMELILSKKGEYNLGADVTDLLEKTYESNIKVIHLVNDLLDVSRIDQNRVKITIEKFDLCKVCNQVIDQLEYEFSVKKLKLHYRVKKGNRYLVQLDKRQFSDVVSNLVHNAIKYSYPATKVYVSLEKKENYFIVKITNTGIGIKKRDQKHIYEKFFRGTNAIKSSANGTGMGLFIAKSFVEGWGGTMSFTSVENQTTTFTFTIPIKRNN